MLASAIANTNMRIAAKKNIKCFFAYVSTHNNIADLPSREKSLSNI